MRNLRFDDVLGVVALFLLLGGWFWLGAGLGLFPEAEQLLREVR